MSALQKQAPPEESVQESQQASAYALLGGESKVFALVDHFYDLMDQTPEYYAIRKLHPASLDGSREKLKLYLSGWLGGPNLYIEQFGHPRLRARHLPFAIGINERNLWLACMFSAMEEVGVEEPLKTRLMESFYGAADWMRNKEE